MNKQQPLEADATYVVVNEKFQPASTDGDLLPVVNERDEPLGALPRRQVHLEKRLHRAVQVMLIDPAGCVWLQQRSPGKDSYPGYWDISCTGHVDPGESYDEAARRELREELGIDGEPIFVRKIEAAAITGWEFQSAYWLPWTGEPDDYNRDEIEQMRRFTPEELRQTIRDPATHWPTTPCVALQLPYLLRAAGFEFFNR